MMWVRRVELLTEQDFSVMTIVDQFKKKEVQVRMGD